MVMIRKEKRNREIVRLRDEDGLTFREIGERNSIARNTVHDVYYREKKRDGVAVQKKTRTREGQVD